MMKKKNQIFIQLKAFLDDMVKALDESTAETNSKEEIKRQLSYIIREIDPLY